MTQTTRARSESAQIASRSASVHRTLAQRRADFAAQMRAMALADLSEVSTRLRALRAELAQKEAREITQYEVADEANIAYRTFQSWEAGANENTDGRGYEKLAQFYSRRLGRKITRNWIVFGQDEAPPIAPSEPIHAQLAEVFERLSDIEEALGVSDNGRSEEGGDPAEIAEQTAAEVEAEQSSAKPDRKRQQSA